MKSSIQIIICLVLLTGCGQPSVDLSKEKDKIGFAWRDWSKKSMTGKPDSLAYYYADEAMIIGTDPEFIKGKAEAIKMYAKAASNFEMDIKWENEQQPNIIQFSNDGSMAYSLDGNAVPVRDTTGVVHMVHNKVLHIWKKDSQGNWRVSLLMVYPQR